MTHILWLIYYDSLSTPMKTSLIRVSFTADITLKVIVIFDMRGNFTLLGIIITVKNFHMSVQRLFWCVFLGTYNTFVVLNNKILIFFLKNSFDVKSTFVVFSCIVERWIFMARSETNFWPHSGHSIFLVSIGSYFGVACLLARLAARLLVLLLSASSSSAARLVLLSLAPYIRDSISLWDTIFIE